MRNLEYEYQIWINLYETFGDQYSKDMAKKTLVKIKAWKKNLPGCRRSLEN